MTSGSGLELNELILHYEVSKNPRVLLLELDRFSAQCSQEVPLVELFLGELSVILPVECVDVAVD